MDIVSGVVAAVAAVKENKDRNKDLDHQKHVRENQLQMEREKHEIVMVKEKMDLSIRRNERDKHRIAMEKEKVELSMRREELKKMREGSQDVLELQQISSKLKNLEVEMQKQRDEVEQEKKKQEQNDATDGYSPGGSQDGGVEMQGGRRRLAARRSRGSTNTSVEENMSDDQISETVIERKPTRVMSATKEEQGSVAASVEKQMLTDTVMEVKKRPEAEEGSKNQNEAKENDQNILETALEIKNRPKAEEHIAKKITVSEELGMEIYNASKVGDLKKVMSAIQGGGDINFKKPSSGLTPLYWASARGHLPIVQLLIQANAKTDIQDEQGWTALRAARAWGHTAVVQELEEIGAKE